MKYIQLAMSRFSQGSFYITSTSNFNFIFYLALQRREGSDPVCSSLLFLDSSPTRLSKILIFEAPASNTLPLETALLQLSNHSPICHSLNDLQLLVSLCNTTCVLNLEDFNVHDQVTSLANCQEGVGVGVSHELSWGNV